MKIYVSHSTSFDFKNELYIPLRESQLNNEHEIILPHEFSNTQFNSKEAIPTCDLIIAEVSFPSTGQGIELGWANWNNKTIVCIYKEGAKYSGSLKVVSNDFIEYKDQADLVNRLEEFLSKFEV